jgi:hypothetical protein
VERRKGERRKAEGGRKGEMKGGKVVVVLRVHNISEENKNVDEKRHLTH